MLIPTHAQPQRRPAELFTNRERAREQFITALEKPQGAEEHRVLVWSAPGGQGKTALLEAFERILKRRNDNARSLSAPRPGFALIDFNNAVSRSIALALLSIREKLGETVGRHFFPAFDTACLRYMMMTEPGANIKDLRARLFSSGSEALDTITQAIEAGGQVAGLYSGLPGFSLLSKFGSKLVGKAGHALHTWWTESGERVFADIHELSQDALLRKLPSYLGLDLIDTLAAKRASRLVVMIDTYEALWRGHGLRDGPGALRIDDWVRLLVQDAPGVLFAIAGRDRLRWGELDSDWVGVIEQHMLGGLTRPDAETLLSKWQVVEPEITARMIDGARSREFGEIDLADNTAEAYLPFYLELEARTYGNIKAGGETPKPEDFGGDHPQILARFLDHLDIETDKLLRVASYPAMLDPAQLGMLAEKFLGGRASADWSRVYTRSLVSEERDGTRFLHDLLRSTLQERERRERPELYRDIHRALFAWFEERCGSDEPKSITQEHERAFLAALRHLSRIDERETVRWSNRQMQRFGNAARWRALEEACGIVLPLADRAFGPEDPWTTANLFSLASALAANSRYAEAEQLYGRVRAIVEKTLGPEHPSTGATLINIADVYRLTSRCAEAAQLLATALRVLVAKLPSRHPRIGRALLGRGQVHAACGRRLEAARDLKEAIAIFEAAGMRPEQRWAREAREALEALGPNNLRRQE